jgi:hypothetical protein
MNFKQIKDRALEYLSKAKTILKETWSLPYAKLYMVLALVMTVFFVFVTFPYEILIRNQLQKLESTIGRNIQIGTIDFSLIGDTYIDSISITFSNGAELNLKDIALDLSINPYTLLVRKNVRGDLGISSFKYAKQDLAVNNTFKSAFNIRLDRKTGIPTDGEITIDLSNVYLKGINIKGFDIPPVRFTSIKGAGTIRNRRLRIENLAFSGTDVRGEIKGSMLFEQMAGASRINLFAYINSDSKILQDYKMLLDTMVETEPGKIKIEIGGNFANPDVKLPFKTEGKSEMKDDDDDKTHDRPVPGRPSRKEAPEEGEPRT